MRANPPSLFVTPKRPSFTNGGTDSADYAWFVWGLGASAVRILDVPPPNPEPPAREPSPGRKQ